MSGSAVRAGEGDILRILYAGTLPPYTGGSAVVGGDLVTGWAARGHRVRAVAPVTAADAGTLDQIARLDGVDVRRYEVPRYDVANAEPDPVWVAWERQTVRSVVRSALDDECPDVVVVGRESFGWSVPSLAVEYRVPSVLITHNGEWPRSMALPGGAQRFAPWLDEVRQVDRVVAVAGHLGAAYEESGLGPVTVIQNGVDPVLFRPGPRDAELAASLDLADDDLVAVHVSNFAPVKRTLDIVASAAAVTREVPQLRYLLVGDGAEFAATRRAVEAAGLGDRFRFTGWIPRSEVARRLRLGSLAINASWTEGLALSYLEALSAGLVLVASDIPAAREVVTHGSDALLFPVGDVEALTAATLRVVREPGLRRRLADAGRRSAARHVLADVVDAHLQVLREVAA